jgi:hypothetical protein
MADNAIKTFLMVMLHLVVGPPASHNDPASTQVPSVEEIGFGHGERSL